MSYKYALFAGNGDLPLLLEKHFHQNDIPYIIIGFHDLTHQQFPSTKDVHFFCIGEVGKIVTFLKQNKVTHITMAGDLKRPSLKSLKFDWMGSLWLAKIGIKAFGDDGLLSSITSLLKNEGFDVVSPHSFLKTLCTEKGILTTHKPSEEDLKDIERGQIILDALSVYDVGQAIVVQHGIVLGIEAVEGTKELLKRILSYKRAEDGGVLIKIPKKEQSMLVDLPTVGPETFEQMNQANLHGIAIAYQGTQILHYQKCLELANQYNLFIISL
jgi:hypothetical protein